MNTRLRAWTGPGAVREIAAACRDAGLHVVCEGTEHVYVDVEGSAPDAAAWNALASLFAKHGKDYGLRFLVCHDGH